jgi:hypothetical protein
MTKDDVTKPAPEREQATANVRRLIPRRKVLPPEKEHKFPPEARPPQQRAITDNDDDPGPTAA